MKLALLAVRALLFLGIVVVYVMVWPTNSLYLVAVGPTPRETIDGLAAYAREKCKLDVTILGEIPLQKTAINRKRRQLNADEVLSLMRRAHPWLTWNLRATVIGITPYDMYTRHHPEWGYVFNWMEYRSAVISMARLDPVFVGMPADPALLERRLQKLLARDIGIKVFLQSKNKNPMSVLFDGLGSLDDVDRVSEDAWDISSRDRACGLYRPVK